jgi:hypothetical protein
MVCGETDESLRILQPFIRMAAPEIRRILEIMMIKISGKNNMTNPNSINPNPSQNKDFHPADLFMNNFEK